MYEVRLYIDLWVYKVRLDYLKDWFIRSVESQTKLRLIYEWTKSDLRLIN